MNIKIGCSGFPIKKEDYCQKFQVVEVLDIFYQKLDIKKARAWKDASPKNFEFTVKAGQRITHPEASGESCGFFRPTDEVMKAWEETEKIVSVLGARTIVFQTPPTFTPDEENVKNMSQFFESIKRDKYNFVWEPEGTWEQDKIRGICRDLDLTHCTDPFSDAALEGKIRYFRMKGIVGSQYKYKGIDLKRLRDFCENEAETLQNEPVYVIFENVSMLADAQRFEWILENTGRIKEINIEFLENLCHKIECVEEDAKVQKLTQEAERIVTLILHSDYARVDIEIEKSKLRELCKELFPGKEYLYEMIYSQRFDRLWEQFREEDQEAQGE